MKYRRTVAPGGTFFFTLVTYNRLPLLNSADRIALLHEAFQYVMERHIFELDAYVVLPDHLHVLWTLPDGDNDFSTRWRLIKSYFSHHLQNKSTDLSQSRIAKKEQAVWQRRFWEHFIRDDADFENHLNYVHYNPVKHRLANCALAWPYSSFSIWVQRGVYPEDWGSQELNLDVPSAGE